MRIEELKSKLSELNVPKEWYSINEGLKFDNENDACVFFLSKLEKEMEAFHMK